MDILTALHSRVTAGRLTNPAPDDKALEQMFTAAARAPDHGRLAPWRFIIISEGARERFAKVLADSKRRASPDADERVIEADGAKAMRAPMIIVVAARVTPNHKVPEIEQLLAAAAATQNLVLAAHALGFGTMWKTGAAAYDPVVKRALGMEERDHIVGFIYVGTSAIPVPVRPPELTDRVSRW